MRACGIATKSASLLFKLPASRSTTLPAASLPVTCSSRASSSRTYSTFRLSSRSNASASLATAAASPPGAASQRADGSARCSASRDSGAASPSPAAPSPPCVATSRIVSSRTASSQRASLPSWSPLLDHFSSAAFSVTPRRSHRASKSNPSLTSAFSSPTAALRPSSNVACVGSMNFADCAAPTAAPRWLEISWMKRGAMYGVGRSRASAKVLAKWRTAARPSSAGHACSSARLTASGLPPSRSRMVGCSSRGSLRTMGK
mmetsp:Transcript_40531/g.127777  ORF Transcript_40531/g.127777 Transcript_40531/m.127777 type:complete len:260 (-) Transcript_40531:1537-2316(-)